MESFVKIIVQNCPSGLKPSHFHHMAQFHLGLSRRTCPDAIGVLNYEIKQQLSTNLNGQNRAVARPQPCKPPKKAAPKP